jgi:2-isopropylmalate synthase
MTTASAHDWAFNRVEVRYPSGTGAMPVARVELRHPVRDRVSDLAAAPTAVQAAMLACCRIIGIDAEVTAMTVDWQVGNAPHAIAHVTLSWHGRDVQASATDEDVVPACVSAYVAGLNALAALRTEA